MKLAKDICKNCGGENIKCICYKPFRLPYVALEIDAKTFNAIIDKLKEAGPEYLERYLRSEIAYDENAIRLILHFGGEVALTLNTNEAAR